MDEKSKNETGKKRFRTRGFKRWFFLTLGLYPPTLGAFLLTGGLHSASDWNIALMLSATGSGLASAILIGSWCLFHWLCVGRNLQRFLFGTACVGTVIALGYAEEDWRGHHAWEQVRHQWEAKNGHFDRASVVPGPVPDDQNFALTPLVASSYAMYCDRTGRELNPRNTNAVNRMVFDLYGCQNVPYTAGDWTLAVKTDLPGLQRYYRTLAATTNLYPVPEHPGTPAADVLLALSRYDATVEELRRDARLPLSRFPLNYYKDDPAAILLPHLAAVKRAAYLLWLRAAAELQTGRSDLALADVQLTLRLVESVRTEPFIISHLVRISTVKLALQPVWEGLAGHDWTDVQLQSLNASLAGLDFLQDYEYCGRGAAVFQTAEIDYIQANHRRFSFIQIFDQARRIPPSVTMAAMYGLMNLRLAPAGWFDQNRAFCARRIEEGFMPLVDLQTRTVNPERAGQEEARIESDCAHLTPYNLMEGYELPNLDVTARDFAQAQTYVDLARVAIALERFRLAQGKYPDALAALSPQFLDYVPVDVIGGQPLHYRLLDDGQFVLYSVGWNQVDDGGIPAKSGLHSESPDPSQGDWVWRYPAR